MHVALDLHGEEFRGEEQAGLAVPALRAVVHGVGGERSREVLVHADGHAELVVAQAQRVRRLRQRAGRGGAAVVDVGERQAGGPEEVHDGVGVVDFVAPSERELHVLPGDPRVGQRHPRRFGRHLEPGYPGEAAEGVQAHTDDGDIVHGLQSSFTGRNA